MEAKSAVLASERDRLGRVPPVRNDSVRHSLSVDEQVAVDVLPLLDNIPETGGHLLVTHRHVVHVLCSLI